jgi:hypothetical protein
VPSSSFAPCQLSAVDYIVPLCLDANVGMSLTLACYSSKYSVRLGDSDKGNVTRGHLRHAVVPPAIAKNTAKLYFSRKRQPFYQSRQFRNHGL